MKVRYFSIFLLMICFYLRTDLKCATMQTMTLYAAIKSTIQVISNLSNYFGTLTKWFYDNSMMLLRNVIFNVVNKNPAKEKMLGVTIENKFNFKSNINICTVGHQKLSVLCRISNYINSDKCKLLVNAFV